MDKNVKTNAQGEEFMILDERVRKVRDIIKSSKLLRKLYFGILHLPRERLLEEKVNEKIQEGKEIIIVEGATLGDFKIYNRFDYLISVNVPFIEREKRVIQRNDAIFDKNTMVERDLDFQSAEKNGRKKGKKINKVVQNTGTIQDLQKTADEIYFEIIDNDIKKRKIETVRERYGGYKTKPIDMTKIASKSTIREKNKTK